MTGPLVYIIAGEPSGDALGAGLMRALKAAQPDIRFEGIGGAAMEKEGLRSLFPYRELSIMGFLEVLPHVPQILRRLRQTAQDVVARQPAALITIDSPGFTFRLAKALRETPAAASIRRIHYVAPSVWAYKPQRAAKTARLFHLLLTLLPFEPPYFEKEGLKSVFAGHPVLWQDWNGNGQGFRAAHGIAPEKPILLILPGSRASEVRTHLPVFLQSADRLPGYVPVILAGSLVANLVRELTPPGTIVAPIEEKKNAFAATSLALSKSGTVTLELAAAGVPMVVAHKVNRLSAWLIRRMLLIPYTSLVNIAVGKAIVPECMQENCTPAFIGEALKRLTQPDTASQQRKDCSEAIRLLRANQTTPPDTLAATAVLECIHSPLTERSR